MAPTVSPLDDVLKRAGAHMAERQGWMVAADFGSLASELAVSRAAAGLADASNVGKFELRGPEYSLAAMYPSGRPLGAQRAVLADGNWWCAVSRELLLVLTEPGAAARVREELTSQAAAHEVTIADVTADRAVLCMMGPAASEVLLRAGVAPHPEGTVRTESVAGIPLLVLHQRARRWLLVGPAADAAELWHALSDAGARLGLAYVGADALRHLVAAGER
jgi:glycine cleavage system aminomethyltransferase T